MATMPHARRRKPIFCADFGAFFRQIGSISSLSSLMLHSDKSKALITFSAYRGLHRPKNRIPALSFAALCFDPPKRECNNAGPFCSTCDSYGVKNSST